MNYKDFEDLFELAANQARAIKTLHDHGCIQTPRFIAAKESLRSNLKQILSGSVPVYVGGDLMYAEDKPACIDAYRTIALFTKEYDRQLEKIENLGAMSLNSMLEKIELLPEVPEHNHEPLQVVLVQSDKLESK